MDITTTQGMKQALTDKLRLGFGVTPEEADEDTVLLGDSIIYQYQFRENYYFVSGDKIENS